MAVIIGESGAWKQVRQLAWQAGILVEQPAHIPLQLAKARQALLQQDTLARDDLAVQRIALERRVAHERISADRDIALIRARSDESLAHLAPRPWTAIVRAARRAQMQRQIRRRSEAVVLAERTLDDFIAHEETEVARRVDAANKVVVNIEAVANSRELAGAVAELDVIRTLSALPDSYTLLNDVSIGAQHPVPSGNSSTVTAQLNHLLIGPTGVSAITTLNWSRDFLQEGDHTDPIRSIVQACALCRSVLKDAGIDQRVEAVIVCAEAMPENPGGERVAVMPITRLLGYVQHAAPRLSLDETQRVLRALAVPAQTR
jgi:hypothetical protein